MKVFLSYRRADSQATAGRLAQFLDGIHVVDKVFLDVDGIAPGEQFEQKIQSTLAEATHVFVLIGPQWAGPARSADAQGAPGATRIFDADDMVRRETQLALAGGVKLIPVLLDETRMPRPDELPDDLKPLAKINAYSLRTAHFNEDMDALLDTLLGNKPGRGSRWRQAPLTLAGVAWRVLGGAVGGALLLLALAMINYFADGGNGSFTRRLQDSFGIDDYEDAAYLVIVGCSVVLGLGALAPFVPQLLKRRR
jgi:hypothetical protein